MIIIPWIYIYYYKWFSVQSTNDYENLILDESEKRIRFFNINRCTSIDFVELLKLEFHLISPSIRMYRNAISNHRAHVSTTYVIYRTVHCVTGSTRVCTNGTGNDWHDCNVRDIGNGDTRYPEQSTPRAFEDVIRSIQIADCGNVATHYVKFNDSRPGPPRATRSQTSPSPGHHPQRSNLFSLATPFCNIQIISGANDIHFFF